MIRTPIVRAVRHKSCCTPALSLSRPYGITRLGILCPARARVFTTTPSHRKEEPRIQSPQNLAPTKMEDADSIQLESVAKEKPADIEKKDPLLAEQTVSNKEQRKADWAIIKEMSKYLWPKVRTAPHFRSHFTPSYIIKDNLGTRTRVVASLVLLVGAKVVILTFLYRLMHVLRRVCRSSMYKYHFILKA